MEVGTEHTTEQLIEELSKVEGLSEDIVRVYRPGSPELAKIYRRGENADAEPAVPGWWFPVDELFD